MKVLVTGGTRFIGRALVAGLGGREPLGRLVAGLLEDLEHLHVGDQLLAARDLDDVDVGAVALEAQLLFERFLDLVRLQEPLHDQPGGEPAFVHGGLSPGGAPAMER